MRPSLFRVSDGLCVRHAGSSRDRLPINCFCAEESIAHPALMLPISLLIVLPLIRGTWQKWPGHVFFLCRCLLINNPFLPRPPITPQNDFLIKLSIRFCGRTTWLSGRTARRVMRLEGSASRASSGRHVSDNLPPLATCWSFLKRLLQCWDQMLKGALLWL